MRIIRWNNFLRFFVGILFLATCVWGEALPIHPKPIDMIPNPIGYYTLINSVDYHPTRNLFCVTYTQGNKIILYKNNANGRQEVFQTLSNPKAKFSHPQQHHAVFSPDGRSIAVANWTNETITIYKQKKDSDHYSASPTNIFPYSNQLNGFKPHGIAFSPSGDCLAVIFGVTEIFREEWQFLLWTKTTM